VTSLQAAPLIAVAMNPTSGSCVDGDTVVLTAAPTATSPVSSNLVYTWTVGAVAAPVADITTTTTTPTTSSFTYRCTTAGGPYTVSVTAVGTNTATSTAATAQVTVTNPLPIITTVSLLPSTARIGELITLTAAFTDASKTATNTYTLDVNWNNLDSITPHTTATTTGLASTGPLSVTKTYTVPGTYTLDVAIKENSASPQTVALSPSRTITISPAVSVLF
jgi:hypothetical protein